MLSLEFLPKLCSGLCSFFSCCCWFLGLLIDANTRIGRNYMAAVAVDSNFSISRNAENKKKQWAAISTCCPALRVVPREDAVRRWLRSDLPGIRRLTNDAHQAAQWTQSGYRIEGGDLRSPASGQCLSTEHRRRRKSIFKPRLITHYEKLQSLMFSVAYQNQFFQIINKKKSRGWGWGSPFTMIIIIITVICGRSIVIWGALSV